VPVQSPEEILDSRIEVIDDKKIPVEVTEQVLLDAIFGEPV
jgi:hypothetical protein